MTENYKGFVFKRVPKINTKPELEPKQKSNRRSKNINPESVYKTKNNKDHLLSDSVNANKNIFSNEFETENSVNSNFKVNEVNGFVFKVKEKKGAVKDAKQSNFSHKKNITRKKQEIKHRENIDNAFESRDFNKNQDINSLIIGADLKPLGLTNLAGLKESKKFNEITKNNNFDSSDISIAIKNEYKTENENINIICNDNKEDTGKNKINDNEIECKRDKIISNNDFLINKMENATNINLKNNKIESNDIKTPNKYNESLTNTLKTPTKHKQTSKRLSLSSDQINHNYKEVNFNGHKRLIKIDKLSPPPSTPADYCLKDPPSSLLNFSTKKRKIDKYLDKIKTPKKCVLNEIKYPVNCTFEDKIKMLMKHLIQKENLNLGLTYDKFLDEYKYENFYETNINEFKECIYDCKIENENKRSELTKWKRLKEEVLGENKFEIGFDRISHENDILVFKKNIEKEVETEKVKFSERLDFYKSKLNVFRNKIKENIEDLVRKRKEMCRIVFEKNNGKRNVDAVVLLKAMGDYKKKFM